MQYFKIKYIEIFTIDSTLLTKSKHEKENRKPALSQHELSSLHFASEPRRRNNPNIYQQVNDQTIRKNKQKDIIPWRRETDTVSWHKRKEPWEAQVMWRQSDTKDKVSCHLTLQSRQATESNDNSRLCQWLDNLITHFTAHNCTL